MMHRFRVSVSRKPGLSDPEGTTTLKALQDLGFTDVSHVAFGRTIDVDLEAASADDARTALEAMCEKLLANPVIESYTIEERT